MSTFIYDYEQYMTQTVVVHKNKNFIRTTCEKSIKQMKLREVSVMNSIGDECTASKAKYEACFNTWFSEKFLRGEVNI